MPRRNANWNEGLAKDLKGKEFAQEFILASLDEGLSIQAVLGKVIRAFGVEEFSKQVKIPSSNILRAINEKHNPTIETVNILLKPFALRLGVSLLRGTKRAA